MNRPRTRTYVLDTSVLLADPQALTKFDEHAVVLPIVVLDELEAKRHHPQLGFPARQALRHLEQLRVTHGRLTDPVPVNDNGGTVQVELNHRDPNPLPPALRHETADTRILAVAANLDLEGHTVTVVSKDGPLRLRASIAGLDADEYLNEQADRPAGSGIERLTVDASALDKLFAAGDGGVDPVDLFGLETADTLAYNVGLVCTTPEGRSGLARLHPDRRVRPIYDRTLHGFRGNSAEQKIALDLLDDPNLPLVGVSGVAGTGKTLAAVVAALASLDRGDHDRIVVLRSLREIGGESLGTLPGDEDDKLAPAARAVFDALEAAVGQRQARLLMERRTVEVLPITHLRGRTVTGTYLVVDEAQQYELQTLLSILTRAGGPGTRGATRPTKVVLTHDVAQRDNPYVGRHDGIAAATARLANNPEFGHIELARVERSAVAALAGRVLDDGR